MQDLSLDIEDLQQDFVVLESKEDSATSKISILSAIVSKQHKMLTNMNNTITDMSKRLLESELVILHLKEIPNDKGNLMKSVIATINNVGYTQDIDIELVYRRGAPRDDDNANPRPVIVRLHRRDTTESILKMASKSKTPRDQPRIVPHIPEQMRQQRAKYGAIAHKKYLIDSSATIKVKDDHVVINNEKIRDDVTTATPEEVLFMDPKTSASIQYCTFITTDTITCKQSAFQMFMCDAATKDQCRTAHKAIASIPEAASATHLISAYILNTGEIGWQDDGDHGLGNFLFKTMEARGVTNAICFMSREYGGTHIGRRRFEILQTLVNNILINREAPADRHGNHPYRIAPPP
jgi:hypothetical protein